VAEPRPLPGRTWRIVGTLLRTSIQAQAQYRVDFLVQLVLAFFWVGWNVAPLMVIFGLREQVAGWRFPEAMLVMSAFLILKALLEGVVMPNVNGLVQHIRTGTFDFILLKPADAQLLVSLQKVLPAKAVDLAAGLLLGAWAARQLDPAPSAGALLAGLAMLGSGALAIYAIWMLIVCSAFWVVKIDNVGYLFSSIFDAARWPISVFRGWIRVVLTYVLPLAVMTTHPAMAVLGKLEPTTALFSVLTSLGLLALSRAVWRWALTHYSSASS
jgi:ABC-2 type transport system permease protein